jgi:hypothetical protein
VNCFIYKQSKNLKLTHFFLDCKNIKIFSRNSAKTRGAKDFISSVGLTLVSGNCHEPEEPIGVTELYNNWRTCSYTSFSQRSEAKKMVDFDVCSRHFHDNWSVILTELPLTNRDPELQTTFSLSWFWQCF